MYHLHLLWTGAYSINFTFYWVGLKEPETLLQDHIPNEAAVYIIYLLATRLFLNIGQGRSFGVFEALSPLSPLMPHHPLLIPVRSVLIHLSHSSIKFRELISLLWDLLGTLCSSGCIRDKSVPITCDLGFSWANSSALRGTVRSAVHITEIAV